MESLHIFKRVSILTRFLSLILVAFWCVNNFAAIVSDNDGSAFITKAEFDSLKNNFQTEIDKFNTSIDSKIDNAIASYLSGIKVTKITELKVLYPNPENDYCNVKWTSSQTYSYDTVENKYWHYYCDFSKLIKIGGQSIFINMVMIENIIHCIMIILLKLIYLKMCNSI